MADTGAPWNLPYPLGTDLVRDGAQAIQDLAEATATGLSNIPVLAGIGSNTVQAVKLNTFSTSSATFTTVTGLTVTITPSSASARVLILVNAHMSATGTNAEGTHIRIDGGNSATFIGNADGSRVRAAGTFQNALSEFNITRAAVPMGLMYLDSPATASPVTYEVQMRVSSGTAFFNRPTTDANSAAFGRVASSIIAIEVAP